MTFPHTKIPNLLLDSLLPTLTEAELKIILVIIRQTIGWIDKYTGSRKTRDRITQSQFVIKTGLSRRIISRTLKLLSDKEYVQITDTNSNTLKNSLERKGKAVLYYSLNPVHFRTSPNAQTDTRPVHKSAYNKRNYSKENITKGRDLPIRQNVAMHIGDIIRSKYIT
jgi:DNA-binding transcriptional ArsR family regulator